MRLPRALALLGLFAPLAPALAQTPESPYGWLLTINAKAVVSPKWMGSSDYGFIAYPTLSIRRPGAASEWSSPDDSISFAALSGNGFSAGPVVAYRGGRYVKDDARLRGLHKVGWTLEPGLFGQFWIAPDMLRVRAEVRRGFRQEDGFVLALGADFVTRYRDLTFALGPRLDIADARFMGTRFGVTPADSLAAPAYAPHDPGGGVYSVGAYGSVTYQYTKDLAFTLHGGWEHLTGGAASSPIVTRIGARDQFTAGLVASYTFGFSP